MSVYNGETYIEEAIKSVLQQSFVDFEFIIFEDCSTDNSLEIIQSFKDSRIVCLRNPENRGLTRNLQKGMTIAKGKYLARMDADDICEGTRLEKQVKFLDKNPDISLLGTAVTFFQENNYSFVSYQPLNHEEIKIELLIGYTMMHPSIMLRLADFRLHRLNYNSHFKYSQDFDLWVRSSRKLKFANLNEPLIRMREHPNKISRELRSPQKSFSNEIRKYMLMELGVDYNENEKKVFDKIGSSERIISKMEFRAVENLFNKILHKNAEKKIYEGIVLEEKLIKRIREEFYLLLKDGNKKGNNFWLSKLFWQGKFDPIFFSKVFFRSIVSIW